MRATPLSPDEVVERLTDPLSIPDCLVEGIRAGHHIDLMTPRARRHFWSPRLSLEVLRADGAHAGSDAADDADSHGSVVHGLFGPRPSVWTLFATLYGFLAFVALVGAMFAYSQWTIDVTPTALWALPACAAGALALYGTSLVGQRLARDEMQVLLAYLLEALGEGDPPETAPPDTAPPRQARTATGGTPREPDGSRSEPREEPVEEPEPRP